MLGGDGACMGCGEKTILTLVFSALNALMQPRVKAHVERLDGLIARLDEKARRIPASEADLTRVAGTAGPIDVPLAQAKKQEVERIAGTIRDLRDLRWRYTE